MATRTFQSSKFCHSRTTQLSKFCYSGYANSATQLSKFCYSCLCNPLRAKVVTGGAQFLINIPNKKGFLLQPSNPSILLIGEEENRVARERKVECSARPQ
jgi:hypothetical protein